MTLCSPDPQAFRPPEDKVNVLQVRLPTNFKSARFDSDAHTAILRQLADGRRSRALRHRKRQDRIAGQAQGARSVFVPLAKWSMLMAGNYRCVQKDAARSIKEAVHSDIETTRAVYDWVFKLCVARRSAEGSRAVRKVRTGGALARHAVVRGARAVCRRARISSASIAWCRPSPRNEASATRCSTRRSRSSMRGWSSTARRRSQRTEWVYSVCKDFSCVSRLRSSPEPAPSELTGAKGVASSHFPDVAAVYDPSQGTGCVFANGLVAQ